jgi:hypothetical protein
LKADSFDSAPPEVKNTACMFFGPSSISLSASWMAGTLLDPV